MELYRIAHYKKEGSALFINGGTLTVTDTEYIVHYMSKEVVRFSAAETTVTKASPDFLYEGIKLSNSSASIEMYFFKNSAKKIFKLFQL